MSEAMEYRDLDKAAQERAESQDAPGATQTEMDGVSIVRPDMSRPGESYAVARHACQRRGCGKPLAGLREHGAFCSDLCRQWASRHPEDDLRKALPVMVPRKRRPEGPADQDMSKRSAQIRAACLALLMDYQVHTPAEFMAACGAGWSAINPRLRDLRKPEFGGWDIPRAEFVRHTDDGVDVYGYRLVRKEDRG